MKTKLFSFVLLILLSTHLAIAQISDKVKMSVEILGGVNLQNINGKDHNGDKLENDPLTGFHAGIKLNIPVAHDFYFQPGLLFSVKGANDNFSVPNGAEGVYKTNTRLSYFEIPFNLLYRPKSGIGHILLGIGPYIAYGTGGKEKSEIGTLTYERKVKYKSKVTDMIDLFENAYYRPFDAGANIFVGYELSVGIFCQMNVQFGMLRINPEYDWAALDKTSYMNTGFGLTVGYRF